MLLTTFGINNVEPSAWLKDILYVLPDFQAKQLDTLLHLRKKSDPRVEKQMCFAGGLQVFGVSVSEFLKSNGINEEVNLPLLGKIKLIDTLGKDERQALFKMIDLAIANKRMNANLQNLINQ